MKYTIVRTDKSNDQLYDIINYIAEDSGDIDIALNYLDKIEQAVMGLEEFPYKGTPPRYSILRKQGYFVLIVEKHLIFYKVNEKDKLITIYAVVDSRREYLNLII
jgi:toxin ParE1/3/4